MAEGPGKWLAACVLALGVANAHAEAPGPLPEARVVELSAADLEEAFWICDYAATTAGMQATPVDLCSAIYEELKARKFGGDFDRLLAWWRQNKATQHARLAARTETTQLSP